MCLTYIYYIGSMPKSVEYQFFVQFLKFPELPRQFSPGHVRPMARAYPTSRTCPAPDPDMSESQVSNLYKGVEPPPPLEP
jgi:hypothetical protein